MTQVWVLGSRGLLGSAICRALHGEGTRPFAPVERLRWDRPEGLEGQLSQAVREFTRLIAEEERWEIYWAAGVSAMGSSAESVTRETRALSLLLELLGAEPGLESVSGSLALASSAGAVYAGSRELVINEETLPAPTTPYAHAKLDQEDRVRSFALAHRGTNALLARLSTLYGPGQAHGKQQGLIAHIARSLIRNRATHIYVPLDTVRDYLASGDAAVAMIAALRAGVGSPGTRIEIIASERPTTIAEIVASFRRIARRSPRIISSASRLSALYPRQVQFRSLARPETPRPARTSLLVGIHDVLRAERAAFAAGSAAAVD